MAQLSPSLFFLFSFLNFFYSAPSFNYLIEHLSNYLLVNPLRKSLRPFLISSEVRVRITWIFPFHEWKAIFEMILLTTIYQVKLDRISIRWWILWRSYRISKCKQCMVCVRIIRTHCTKLSRISFAHFAWMFYFSKYLSRYSRIIPTNMLWHLRCKCLDIHM